LKQALGGLRRFLGGEKATLLWDGLPAHRSNAMGRWVNTQRSWLVVERLPAYAPDLNPVEGLWSSLKAVELANLTSPTLAEVIAQGPPRDPAGPPHPAPGLWVAAAHRPVGGMIGRPPHGRGADRSLPGPLADREAAGVGAALPIAAPTWLGA
jgi:hypothetical protein